MARVNEYMSTKTEMKVFLFPNLRIYLGGGFKYFLFSPLLGEDSHFDYHQLDTRIPETRQVDLIKCILVYVGCFSALQMDHFLGFLERKKNATSPFFYVEFKEKTPKFSPKRTK